MKNITVEEIFRNKPIYYGEDIRCNECSDEILLRKIISEKSYLLHALIEEYTFALDAKINNPRLSVSMNCSFFRDKEESLDELKASLQMVYGTIKPITDESDEIIGLYTSDTKPSALVIAKEIYDQGKADNFIYRFLSFSEEKFAVNTGETAVMLENTDTGNEITAGFEEGNFYRQIKRSLSAVGEACFITNCMTLKELENDEYIQALISMGHKVYVHSSSEDNLIKRIIVH